MTNRMEIIDLTNSFTYADHCALSNLVFNVDTDDGEDSIVNVMDASASSGYQTVSVRTSRIPVSIKVDRIPCPVHHLIPDITKPKRKESRKSKRVSGSKTDKENRNSENTEPERGNSAQPKQAQHIGDCPICFDTLGKNPLASTKCGHVYCIQCLEQYLKINKKCPTCRKILKGSSAYHSLYL